MNLYEAKKETTYPAAKQKFKSHRNKGKANVEVEKNDIPSPTVRVVSTQTPLIKPCSVKTVHKHEILIPSLHDGTDVSAHSVPVTAERPVSFPNIIK